MSSYRQVLETFDRPIAFQRLFVEFTGSITAALMLSQAVYWSKRTSDPEHWFYKSQAEWAEETGLSRAEQETARRRLRQVGVLEEKSEGLPRRLFYRINADRIEELRQEVCARLNERSQTSMRESSRLESGNPADWDAGIQQTGQAEKSRADAGALPLLAPPEITTEITTETTTYNPPFPPKQTQNHPTSPVGEIVSFPANGKATDPAVFFTAWNDHCGVLPKCRRNAEAAKLIKRELKTRSPAELVAAISSAAKVVAKDAFWIERGYGLVNLLRHLDSKVEQYQHRGDLSNADAKTLRRAQELWQMDLGGSHGAS